jgi:hypothetical protein
MSASKSDRGDSTARTGGRALRRTLPIIGVSTHGMKGEIETRLAAGNYYLGNVAGDRPLSLGSAG